MNGKIAFVTGSTGLLGSNLIALLLQAGYQVRALVRSVEKGRQQLGEEQVEFVQGDMQDVVGFAQHLVGVDVLFHAAAYFRESFGVGDHQELLEKINVHATIELFEAAAQRGIHNIVYVSALGVLQAPKDEGPFDESAPSNETTNNLYYKSKVVAERAIEQWLQMPLAKEQGIRVVQILPGGMWGPRDAAPTGFGQFVIDYLKGGMPFVLPGSIPFVDARDVAQAMLQAVEQGRNGERFIVGGISMKVSEIIKVLEQVSGVPAPRIRLSFPVATAIARVAETVARFTNQPPALTQNVVAVLRENFAASSAKAEQELGICFRPTEETLRDTAAWYRANGYVS